MRIVVTGGAGYIGSHAARQLARRGHEVVILDNLSTGYASLARGFELVEADIRDRAKVMTALRGADAVMHFAAHAYVGESMVAPQKYFDNNVSGALALLAAVLDAHVPYFVHSSSCAVYGLPSRVPILEDTPRIPVNPYGATKLAVENILEAYGNAYRLRYVNLRYFNAAGADESGEIGELHQPETHLIPRALEVAAGTSKELEIYGTDYPTPDGTCVRDYIHVNDLAQAHLLALEYMKNQGESTAFNLGTGAGKSILEIVSMIEEVTGARVSTRACPRRAGDPAVLVADNARARRLLGWKPSRTLRDIIQSAWNWMQCAATRQ